MKRHEIPKRPQWEQTVASTGLTYHAGLPGQEDGVRWDESVAYEFTAGEVDVIEEATETLHGLCLEAVEHACSNPEILRTFGLEGTWAGYVVRSWRQGDATVMGRFDLAFDPGTGRVSMLEYNADTPTLVIETAVTQWFWLKDVRPHDDQFNSLHEKLIGRYKEVQRRIGSQTTLVFSTAENEEESQHVLYFQDCATQAGLRTAMCPLDEVGWDPSRELFVDQDLRPIKAWAKLYPWEWIRMDEFGSLFPSSWMTVLEPAWKMLLSNKALLPLLWSMFPGHPNLLESHWSSEPFGGRAYVGKPILAREGANVRVVKPGQVPTVTAGPYAGQPEVFQEFVDTRIVDQHRVVIGSWIVGHTPAGMILREGEGDVIRGDDRVVPHFFSNPAA